LEVIQQLKADGYTIVSLEITNTSIDLQKLKLQKDQHLCLILGSEDSGVSQALLDCSDFTVHIPMLGANSSMNVANACAIATYQITRQLSAC
jgi:tRNA G18 (ribose-2'-O)-methylase SpoU